MLNVEYSEKEWAHSHSVPTQSFLQVHWDIEHDSEEEIPTHCLLDKFHFHSFECQRFSILSFAKATNRNVGVVNNFPSFEIWNNVPENDACRRMNIPEER